MSFHELDFLPLLLFPLCIIILFFCLCVAYARIPFTLFTFPAFVALCPLPLFCYGSTCTFFFSVVCSTFNSKKSLGTPRVKPSFAYACPQFFLSIKDRIRENMSPILCHKFFFVYQKSKKWCKSLRESSHSRLGHRSFCSSTSVILLVRLRHFARPPKAPSNPEFLMDTHGFFSRHARVFSAHALVCRSPVKPANLIRSTSVADLSPSRLSDPSQSSDEMAEIE